MDGLMQLPPSPSILYVYILYILYTEKNCCVWFLCFHYLFVCQPASHQPCHVLSVIICLHIQDIVLDTAYYFV